MNNHDADMELELARFGEYLLKSRVVPEKYAPYFVRWVRRFMAQVPSRPGMAFEDIWSSSFPKARTLELPDHREGYGLDTHLLQFLKSSDILSRRRPIEVMHPNHNVLPCGEAGKKRKDFAQLR